MSESAALQRSKLITRKQLAALSGGNIDNVEHPNPLRLATPISYFGGAAFASVGGIIRHVTITEKLNTPLPENSGSELIIYRTIGKNKLQPDVKLLMLKSPLQSAIPIFWEPEKQPNRRGPAGVQYVGHWNAIDVQDLTRSKKHTIVKGVQRCAKVTFAFDRYDQDFDAIINRAHDKSTNEIKKEFDRDEASDNSNARHDRRSGGPRAKRQTATSNGVAKASTSSSSTGRTKRSKVVHLTQSGAEEDDGPTTTDSTLDQAAIKQEDEPLSLQRTSQARSESSSAVPDRVLSLSAAPVNSLPRRSTRRQPAPSPNTSGNTNTAGTNNTSVDSIAELEARVLPMDPVSRIQRLETHLGIVADGSPRQRLQNIRITMDEIGSNSAGNSTLVDSIAELEARFLPRDLVSRIQCMEAHLGIAVDGSPRQRIQNIRTALDEIV